MTLFEKSSRKRHICQFDQNISFRIDENIFVLYREKKNSPVKTFIWELAEVV